MAAPTPTTVTCRLISSDSYQRLRRWTVDPFHNGEEDTDALHDALVLEVQSWFGLRFSGGGEVGTWGYDQSEETCDGRFRDIISEGRLVAIYQEQEPGSADARQVAEAA